MRSPGRTVKTGLTGLLLLAGLLPALQAQEIWRHVDERGSVRYADRPFAGAVRLRLSEASRWSGPAPAAPGQAGLRQDTIAAHEGAKRKPGIVRPAEGETVWGSGGALEVKLGADFELDPGSRLVLELDGENASWLGEPPLVTLNGVWRGEHRLRARVLDARGKELASSREIRFYKREASVIKPTQRTP